MADGLQDIDHNFGGDIGIAASGDLALVGATSRSQQRILRRWLTNPGDYTLDPTYGGGIGRYVGQVVSTQQVAANMVEQMLLEPSVAADPAPVVVVTLTNDTLSATARYTDADGSSQTLAFDYKP